MKVPFVDLKAQYLSIQPEIDRAIADVIADTAFISGSYAKKFEDEFSAYNGMKHCISCANGTDSLEILLKAMNIGSGDEVIVPAISWISTAEAVSSVGAKPVFADVNEHLLIDPVQAEKNITTNTKCIIPVHLYGNPSDMSVLMEIAGNHGLKVLEDCAQSHGAELGGKRTGTFGHCASFSFYPGKNLGAYGDAGAMMTNDDDIARLSRAIANHGQEGKHNHIMEGRNSRMDGIQAAILSAKLPHLDDWTNQRILIAEKYNKQIVSGKVVKPIVRENARHVFHLYVIRVPDRSAFMRYCSEKGIETAIHYPTPLPLLPCYADQRLMPADFPVAAKASAEIVSLPMYPEMTDKQINFVAEHVNEFFS